MGNFDFPEESYTELLHLIDKYGLNIVMWTLSFHMDAQDELYGDATKYCARELMSSLQKLLSESQGDEHVDSA